MQHQLIYFPSFFQMKMIKYLLFLATVISSSHASNILVIAPTPFVGQWLYLEEFIKSLITRGHKVTGITSYNLRQANENYTPIIIPVLNVDQHCKRFEIIV